jgi:hypothetical protein
MVGNTIIIILVVAIFFQVLTIRRDVTRRLDEIANRLAHLDGGRER